MYKAFMYHLLWYFPSRDRSNHTVTFLAPLDWHFLFYKFDSNQSGHVHLISYSGFYFDHDPDSLNRKKRLVNSYVRK